MNCAEGEHVWTDGHNICFFSLCQSIFRGSFLQPVYNRQDASDCFQRFEHFTFTIHSDSRLSTLPLPIATQFFNNSHFIVIGHGIAKLPHITVPPLVIQAYEKSI